MLNQLRADFYRLSRSWGIYLTIVFTIVYSAIITGNKIIGGIMVTGDSMKSLNSVETWSLKDGINASTLSSSILVYVFISIFVITIGYEFSQKTYKNTLVSGITRSQFIISKYLIMLINIFVLILIYFLTSIVTGILASRNVGTSWYKLFESVFNTSLVIAFFISVAMKISLKLIPDSQLWNYVLTSLLVLLVTISLSVVVVRNKEM